MAAAARPGSRRTPRAAACTAGSAPRRAPGTPTLATRAGSTAARASPSALDWAAGHQPELNATERAFLDDSRRASGREQRRLRLVLAGVASLLVARGDRRSGRARPARQCARRGDRGRGAAPRRAGARGGRPRPRPAARAPGRGAGRLARRRAATCSPRCSRARRRSACCAATATGWPAVALSPDDRTLAVLDNDGTLRLVDTANAASGGAGRRPSPALPRTGAWDGPELQRRRLAARGRRHAAGRPGRSHAPRRGSAARRWTVGPSTPALLGGRAHAVRRDLRPAGLHGDPALRRAHRPAARRAAASSVAASLPSALKFTRDGARRDEPRRWPDGGPRRPHPGPRRARQCRARSRSPGGGDQTALSPDDRTLLLGGRDGSVRFLDLGDRQGPRRLRTPRRRRRARGVQRRRTHRRHGRRGQARDRLERRAGRGRETLAGPRRADHRTGDQPRRPRRSTRAAWTARS